MQVEIKLKILVVDDSNISRKWLIEMMPEAIKKSATIIEASNGEDALKVFENERPDIIFLDLTMPGMSGFEVLDRVKQIDKNATVVVVTADRQQTTKEKILALGAIDLLTKPVDSTKFRNLFIEIAFGKNSNE